LLAGCHRKQPFQKWRGTHWVLATLADLGHPPGDKTLPPLCDEVLAHWLREDFFTEFACDRKSHAYARAGVPVMAGHHRRCAS
jgi:hypothetical protein